MVAKSHVGLNCVTHGILKMAAGLIRCNTLMQQSYIEFYDTMQDTSKNVIELTQEVCGLKEKRAGRQEAHTHRTT